MPPLSRAATIAATCALLLLSSCAAPAPATVPAPRAPAPGPATRGPEPPARPPATEGVDAAEPVTCGDGPGLATRFGPVDAALGHRYLVLAVRNCGEQSLGLPAEPELEWIGGDGSELPSTVEFREPQGSLELSPGAQKYLVLHWLSNGACERGAQEVRVRLPGSEVASRDCLQFGGGLAPERDGADADAYWADDPSRGPG